MANIERLPTLEEVKEQYIQCRNEWNTMDHPTSETGMTRMEMYTTLNSPNAELLDNYEVADLFKIFSIASVKYGKQGYCFEIDKKEYRYQVYDESGQVDLNFHMQNVGESFRYRYDPKDMTVIELWKMTASGLVYAATATPKVKIHRATADRTEEENAYLFAQLRNNERARVAHHIASEELLLEECMSEAYTRLIIPRPTGVSEKSMDSYRNEYEDGKLNAPVNYLKGTGPGTYEPELEESGIASVGEFTKETSGLTDVEMYESFLS